MSNYFDRPVLSFIEQAADRLEAAAHLSPGYAASLINLAGEMLLANKGQETEHGGIEWATAVAEAIMGRDIDA